jgi:hypothetical protein
MWEVAAMASAPVREWHVQQCLTPGTEGCQAHRIEKKAYKGRTYVEVWHCDRCIAREMVEAAREG